MTILSKDTNVVLKLNLGEELGTLFLFIYMLDSYFFSIEFHGEEFHRISHYILTHTNLLKILTYTDTL